MTLLRQCAVLVLLSRAALGYRSSSALDRTSLSEATSELEEGEGVNDYPRAEEFPDSWLDKDNYEKLLESTKSKIEELKVAGGETSPEEAKQLLKDLWLLTEQRLADTTPYSCFNLCLMCEPSEADLAIGKLKTIKISRSKSYWDKAKMTLVGPADATAGLLSGVVAGLLTGGAVGVGVGTSVDDDVGGGFAGFMAGSVSGIISGAVTLAFAEAVLPFLGARMGAGLTAAYTNCGRVGFKMAERGIYAEDQPFLNQKMSPTYGLKLLREAMHYNKSWFNDHPMTSTSGRPVPLHEATSGTDYQAISHCEYLRLRPFDIRHAIMCAQHSMLCGRRGGLLIPTTGDSQCAAASSGSQSGTLFADSKEKVECVKLLCSYGGYKKGALLAHPDRLLHMPEEEKLAKTEDFKKMVNCKDKFQLTLNSAEEREVECQKLAQ